MIKGIGNDIIEVERVKKACQNERFLNRNFSELERAYFEQQKASRYYSIALNFALKEAISKALGTGFRQIDLIDIVILRNELGKPYVAYSERLKQRMVDLSIDVIHISGSHTKQYASGFAVAEYLEVVNDRN